MMENRPNDRKPIPLTGWKLRFDAPPPDGLMSRTSAGDVLSLFRAWDGADRDPAERRRSPRYSPAETRAWVGWWRHGHFLVSKAEFINLSEGGALMRLTQKPPTSQPIWVCLGNPAPVDSVQARVLDAVAATTPNVPTGRDTILAPNSIVYVSRLEFHSPCPGSFFEAAGRGDGNSPNPVGNGPS
ncbi:MAG: hypothetical protein AB7I30_08530 [Isosphaeraceae bacterium]